MCSWGAVQRRRSSCAAGIVSRLSTSTSSRVCAACCILYHTAAAAMPRDLAIHLNADADRMVALMITQARAARSPGIMSLPRHSSVWKACRSGTCPLR